MKIVFAIMIGSESDLPQCLEGFEYLIPHIESGEIEFIVFIVNSIHRNTEKVLGNVRELVSMHGVNRLIVGAGMANHLTGTIDAFLRYTLRNDTTIVYGVAFEGQTPDDLETSIRSITGVPGTQVVFDPSDPTFLAACRKMIEEEPPKIELKIPKPTRVFPTVEAVLAAMSCINTK
jgi:phosphoribosylcarboxyaminoimidazole (NCAIR) mutase